MAHKFRCLRSPGTLGRLSVAHARGPDRLCGSGQAAAPLESSRLTRALKYISPSTRPPTPAIGTVQSALRWRICGKGS